MDYFAGLDISMGETHVCVVDREGVVVHQSKTASMAGVIAVEASRKRQVVVASYSRRGGISRSCFTG